MHECFADHGAWEDLILSDGVIKVQKRDTWNIFVS
jgi:hypothetical protein